MPPNNDLQDFVDTPKETLEVEYKQWLDLTDKVVRSKLAQHIAALANHGGGYIVFGFKDDMTPDQNRPADLKQYSVDVFSGVIKKYLTPTLHCDVLFIESAESNLKYPVLRVPSHGEIPICISQSGPEDERKKTLGAVQGTYYIRTVGPASAPIVGPEMWQPLIRRCVLAGREALLRSFTQVLNGQLFASPPPAHGPTLVAWHDRARNKFLKFVASETAGTEWPIPIDRAHFQFSYRILQDTEHKIPFPNLLQTIHQANNEVRNIVWDGWSMFYPFQGEKFKPYNFVDEIGESEFEGLESNLLRKNESGSGQPDFWRISQSGWATIIRVYFEDLHAEGRPANFLDPELLAKDVTEVLIHAIAMAKNYPTAHSVELVCEWVGLKDRVVDSVKRTAHWSKRVSNIDYRKATGVWLIPEIEGSLPQIVPEVINRVLRLFDGIEVTPKWVKDKLPSFRDMA